jgi:hypothetical protein
MGSRAVGAGPPRGRVGPTPQGTHTWHGYGTGYGTGMERGMEQVWNLANLAFWILIEAVSIAKDPLKDPNMKDFAAETASYKGRSDALISQFPL